MASDKTMIFQVASTEAALVCTAKVVNANYSPDIFDDIAARTKQAFLDILPQVMDGAEIDEFQTSSTGVDVQSFGDELI